MIRLDTYSLLESFILLVWTGHLGSRPFVQFVRLLPPFWLVMVGGPWVMRTVRFMNPTFFCVTGRLLSLRSLFLDPRPHWYPEIFSSPETDDDFLHVIVTLPIELLSLDPWTHESPRFHPTTRSMMQTLSKWLLSQFLFNLPSRRSSFWWSKSRDLVPLPPDLRLRQSLHVL